MKLRTRLILIAVLVAAAFVVGAAPPADAVDPGPVTRWHPAGLEGTVRCNRDTGQQEATFTASNTEGQTATIRAATGAFRIGQTIPAHGRLVDHVTKPGSFSGSFTVRLEVNYPADQTRRASSVTVRFGGGCTPPPPPTTTTTAPPATTTTTAPATTTTTAPSSSSTTSPPTSIIPPANICTPDETVPAAVCSTPVFTG